MNRVPELLPPVDMSVTTADPVLEPTIITVNTVLSLGAPLSHSTLSLKPLNLLSFGYHFVRNTIFKLELPSDTSPVPVSPYFPVTILQDSKLNGKR